jgi:hypothetical protein
MHIIEPRKDDTRVSGRVYLYMLAQLGEQWVGNIARGMEYRPVNATQATLGEYQDA